MTDYIKREDVKCIICKSCNPIRLSDCTMCKRIYEINEIPSADAVERKHGKWIKDISRSPIAYRCSACDGLQYWSVIQNGRYHYCPNCGADMRGDINE